MSGIVPISVCLLCPRRSLEVIRSLFRSHSFPSSHSFNLAKTHGFEVSKQGIATLNDLFFRFLGSLFFIFSFEQLIFAPVSYGEDLESFAKHRKKKIINHEEYLLLFTAFVLIIDL